MSKLFQNYKHVFLSVVLVVPFAMSESVFSQHKGHDMQGMNMPGMNMSRARPKKKPAVTKHTRSKRKVQKKRRRATKKHQMGNMNMPGMNMPATPRATASATPHTHMPGMNMPAASASPAPTPGKMDMNMPMPPTSATPHTHMPGMNMPAASASPAPTPGKMDMNMPGMKMPAASPSPVGHTHGNEPAAMGNMDMSSPNKTQPANDSMKGMDMSGTGSMNMGPLLVMNGNDMGIRVGSSDTNVMSMGAMGSGTSWQPASTPMHMIHKVMGDWLVMFHYNAIVGVNSQGGPRGVTKLESQNWFMPMAYHKIGKGTLQLRGMFSFEPFTFPPGGSPLLFQTGETYKGQPLIDKQHPHDLFMELSATYTIPIGERATWFAYVGYPGEPALGPPAFMHRWSASENPSAPLSHHEQDSSHISFGVLTSGFTYRWLKLEGSIFNGREPDENRYNFEYNPWNARSFRVSVAPTKNLSAQWSYGLLRNRELFEHVDTKRMTASIHYNKTREHGSWATSLIWGRNHDRILGEGNFNLNGYTAESTVNFQDKNYLYTRLELVDKNELLRAVDRARLGITDDHPSFRIGAYTFGGARDVYTSEKLTMAVGSDLTFYSKPAVLDQIYGSNPVSAKLFLRFRPGKMEMGSTHGTH